MHPVLRATGTAQRAAALFLGMAALQAADQTPALSAVDIQLTGVVHLRNATPKAYLTVTERGRAPDCVSLSLGEKAGGLEILDVDAVKGRVKLLYRDVPLTISFSGQGANTALRLEMAGREFIEEHSRSQAAAIQRQLQEDLRERADAEHEQQESAVSQQAQP